MTEPVPEKSVVIVRYGELSLKSRGVRDRYEEILKMNIHAMLKANNIPFSNIRRDFGRIFVETNHPLASDVISRVFGVVSVSPAFVCASVLEEITSLCADVSAPEIQSGETYAVRARRNGNHPFSSNDAARLCGDAIWEKMVSQGKTPAVDLTNPDKEIFIEIRQSRSYVYFDSVKGPGGFPTGTQGKMVVLLSGGIDSPVAAWLMMKRGIDIIPVFFDNSPYMSPIALEKALLNAEALFSWVPGRKHKFYRIKNGEYMKSMMETCHQKNICLMCKRFMFRVAGEVMKMNEASGIISGSSLGQVASQTAENMLSETYGLCLPLYHPLIAFDKQEIVTIAQKIGTFENSIRSSDEKECSAVPEKPEIKAKLTAALDEEKRFNFKVEDLVQKLAREAEIIDFPGK
ncbi:tRNA uracil 4-sulfurtransferase ThiI [Methanolapillus millepedarum]|uniref:Probable tRNA sulfurtransferase n=1 Tax=Methanolapillus millepedarum TaxID=3028296 RepID=A0AA97A3A7_9EURY|nr:putative tRNA sulfurtransferase [Methanosarcinaceae archaeon Ac7]